MPRVIVRILHVEPAAGAPPLVRLLADAQRLNAERHRLGFRAAGADEVAVLGAPPDDVSFGDRLRDLLRGAGDRVDGMVVLGSGAVPLMTTSDREAFVAAARAGTPAALTNNRYSSDIVAIACPSDLPTVPDLAADNALPRWLDEHAGWAVHDVRRRWTLAVDLDTPLDAELVEPGCLPAALGTRVRERQAALAAMAGDRRAELVVAGRSSAATLAWLERATACRVRAVVEERGLHASDPAAQRETAGPGRTRPPRSVLGIVLDLDGPEALGRRLAELGDGALVDTRVLLAHRLGADERRWPSAEDRYASDLLLPERITDPWLRDLTAAAVASPVPVLLGGHTLVGPGVRLLLRWRRG